MTAPDWQANATPAVATRRAELLARVREYFQAQHVLEVEVPTLSPTVIPETHIDHISAHSTAAGPLYLQASPEAFMKRLLASGYPDIFALARAYRDGEIGTRHALEFTLLEWYRHGFELQQIIDDTVGVIAAALNLPALTQVTSLSYREALKRAGIDCTANAEDLAAALSADADLQQAIGDDADTWLDLALSTRAAPQFSTERLTVIYHYPASQAALARISPDDANVADRFEVFLGEIELANGYVELADPVEQAARFDIAIKQRLADGKRTPPPDDRLLAALQHGLPACAGVALGIERLHLILEHSDTIKSVQSFTIQPNG
ncbi:MAG: EF-P lysine aminoacylase EpmA [Pseudomonadota bacterium]